MPWHGRRVLLLEEQESDSGKRDVGKSGKYMRSWEPGARATELDIRCGHTRAPEETISVAYFKTGKIANLRTKPIPSFTLVTESPFL
jgi:hypothetical protein